MLSSERTETINKNYQGGQVSLKDSKGHYTRLDADPLSAFQKNPRPNLAVVLHHVIYGNHYSLIS